MISVKVKLVIRSFKSSFLSFFSKDEQGAKSKVEQGLELKNLDFVAPICDKFKRSNPSLHYDRVLDYVKLGFH